MISTLGAYIPSWQLNRINADSSVVLAYFNLLNNYSTRQMPFFDDGQAFNSVFRKVKSDFDFSIYKFMLKLPRIKCEKVR